MDWRRWNSALHLDVGFLCVGLTLAYALAGVAVSHISQWNPSCRVERVEVNIGPVTGDPLDAETLRVVLARLNEPGQLENSFRPDPHSLQLLSTVVRSASTWSAAMWFMTVPSPAPFCAR